MIKLTEDCLTAIEGAIDDGDDLDLSDIRDLVAEVRSLQALERTAWADYQACAAERDAALARVDSLTATLEHARQALLEAQEQQQRDVAEIASLEFLIADHEFEAEEYDTLAGRRISICPVCSGHGGHHTHGLNQPCPWGQAAANHRARQTEVANV